MVLGCTVSVAVHAVSLQPAEQCSSSPDTLCNGLQVGAKVMLGDRPVRVTLARCWAALSRWSRIRFIFSLLWGGLTMGGEDLKAQVEQMKASPSWLCRSATDCSATIESAHRGFKAPSEVSSSSSHPTLEDGDS